MPAVVLLDTNVWVSAFLNPSGPPARVRHAWYAGRYEVVTSLPLLEELSDVLTRPRLTRKYPIVADDVTEFLQLLVERSTVVIPTGSIRECRDPDDDVLLETAILGKAQYVVTRDDDLKHDLDLIEHLELRGVIVLSVRQFLDKLDQGEL